MLRRALPLVLLLVPRMAFAIQLDDPTNFQVIKTFTALDLGVPGHPGGMLFSKDGQRIYVVGDSETTSSAVYELSVQRDATNRVTGFGPATLVFHGDSTIRGLDAGLELGPNGTLFYTYWNAHRLGERLTVTSTVETLFDMTPTGVPVSVAGLTFSPHRQDPGTSFGLMQVSSWLGDGVYDVPLSPLGRGIYEPGLATLFVRLPQQGTGAIQYVPRGIHAGNLMYVNWDFGEVRMLMIDRETGYPIDDLTGLPTLGTETPRDLRFAHDLGVGPWGLEFDPLTFDFFVTTWAGTPEDTIIQFSGPGFANRAPTASDQLVLTTVGAPVAIQLVATDPDLDSLTFEVVRPPMSGTLTGTTSYTPSLGFTGIDHFTFRAFDGQAFSNTATVTITVLGESADGGTSDASGNALDAADAETPDSAARADSGGADANGDPDAAVADTAPSPDAGTRTDGSTGGAVKPTGTSDDCSCSESARGRGPSWVALLGLGFSLLARRRKISTNASPG